MNIALLFGGKSGEHEVSLVSATSIAKTIDTKKHSVILVGIDKNGSWYLQADAMLERVRTDSQAQLSVQADESRRVSVIPGGGAAGALYVAGKAIRADLVFPVLHGTYGEDGTVQGLLEMAGLPYVGGGVMASAIAMDKEKTKILWKAAGYPVVPYIALTASAWNDPSKGKTIVDAAVSDLSWPLFVKPACAGSSVGAAKASNRDELESRISEAFAWDDKILIEPFIPAREIECSVTGNERPKAYLPGEVIPTHEFYDYEAKYTDPNGAHFTIPAQMSDDELRAVKELAVKAYACLDLSGMARVDFFIDKRNGTLYLNEINTIPGFTPISMFPKMCAESGLPYGDLVQELFALALERFSRRNNLRTNRA